MTLVDLKGKITEEVWKINKSALETVMNGLI